MPKFEHPSAISARTSRSRGVSPSSGSFRRRAPTSSCTRPGSTTEPPSSDPLDRFDELVDVGDAALEQVADPLAAGEQLHRVVDLDVGGEHEDPAAGNSSRMTRAASSPSVVCVGWHPDVDDDELGFVRADEGEERPRHRQPGRRPRTRAARAGSRGPHVAGRRHPRVQYASSARLSITRPQLLRAHLSFASPGTTFVPHTMQMQYQSWFSMQQRSRTGCTGDVRRGAIDGERGG